MQLQRATLQTCSDLKGVTVSIDVIRAFTTAAFAFGAGAEEISLVGTVEEAFALRQKMPGALISGEVEGLRVEGFDLWNSPAEMRRADLSGRRLILRTTAGTQGVVLSSQAAHRLTTSFCVASATARFIKKLNCEPVTFIETGIHGPGTGDEDTACADFIEAILGGEQPDPAPYLQRVQNSPWGRTFADPAKPEWPVEDLECALMVDAFDFAMQVMPEDGRLILRPVRA